MTTAPSCILLMGVSGSGKTTLGQALARELGWHFADADAFHSAANVAKMHAGQPLNDTDRALWIASLHRRLAESLAKMQPTVLACSALRKRYRTQLLDGFPPHAVRLVYLQGSRELLATRLATRRNHFMPAALLGSQLATLEEPGTDENALVLDIARPLTELVSQICKTFTLKPGCTVASPHT